MLYNSSINNYVSYEILIDAGQPPLQRTNSICCAVVLQESSDAGRCPEFEGLVELRRALDILWARRVLLYSGTLLASVRGLCAHHSAFI